MNKQMPIQQFAKDRKRIITITYSFSNFERPLVLDATVCMKWIIYVYIYIYIYKENWELNNLHWLICHKNKPKLNVTKSILYIILYKKSIRIK